ncbi:MAG TPA: septal ring lytic transglycosylase RlpA family protein, partial [Cyanobacteria bacterium UBA11148]|nr:septal ring lytic transglycosylase RlpA family protein [Cyanobacteria bacterium UBA11148]
GPYFHGRMTATGETYNQHELTAAHPTLPFNTYLKVRNLENGHSVIVRINDRGPYVSGRSLDLSLQAARSINSEKMGIVPFEAIIMKPTVARSQQE